MEESNPVSSDAKSTAGADQPWTVARVIDWTTGHLKKHGSDTPRLDAEILLAHARNCPRIQLYTHYDEVLSDEVRAVMRELVTRRARAEPVAYLVGHREFYGLDFRITPDVLIPRPDTETLVLELLTLAGGLPQPQILELGTGSGCIAVAAAVNLKASHITAIDISAAALAVARSNVRSAGGRRRVRFFGEQSALYRRRRIGGPGCRRSRPRTAFGVGGRTRWLGRDPPHSRRCGATS